MGRLATAGWIFQAAATATLLVAATKGLHTDTPSFSTVLAIATGACAALAALALPWEEPDAPKAWNRWIAQRVRARAATWLPPALAIGGALALAGPLPLHAAAGLAVLTAGVLGRYGPSLGSDAHPFWAHTPMATLWRWLCPAVRPGDVPAWRLRAAMLVEAYPCMDGQLIVPQYSDRLQTIPMTPSDDPELRIGHVDPQILLRPPHSETARFTSMRHNGHRHMLAYSTGYGGVASKPNAVQIVYEHDWVEAWLEAVGPRDPVMGEGWPLEGAKTAHDKIRLMQTHQAHTPHITGAGAPGPTP